MNQLQSQTLKTGQQITEKDLILRKMRVINGQKVEHTIYHIPGNDIMLLYNVKVDGEIVMSIPFISDNEQYAKRAFGVMNGLFTPNKLSKNRLQKHDYVNKNGKIDIYETITKPKVM